jgi:hypothetical protein
MGSGLGGRSNREALACYSTIEAEHEGVGGDRSGEGRGGGNGHELVGAKTRCPDHCAEQHERDGVSLREAQSAAQAAEGPELLSDDRGSGER